MFSLLKGTFIGTFILTAIGVPVLGIAGLYCLLFCKEEKHYKHLARTAAVFLSSAALLMGGGALLERFGLAWRNAPSVILFSVMMASGWMGLVFTMFCLLPRRWPLAGAAVRRTVKGVLLFLAILILLVGLLLGPFALLFIWGDTERVMEYQGRTLLEVNDGFMDPHWSYYGYHGPLVRGTELVYDLERPINGWPH